METVVIEKLDAACRQLNTAISLWFSNGDPVSIHTLACSAHQIVHDINKKQGGRDLVYDSLVIKDKYWQGILLKIIAIKRRIYIILMLSAANYLNLKQGWENGLANNNRYRFRE